MKIMANLTQNCKFKVLKCVDIKLMSM